MTTAFAPKEYTTRTAADLTRWGKGPWENEPDKIQWVDEKTGLDCLIHRHPRSGHLCGYVGVAEGHPLFEKEYEHADVDVHGGLTYSQFCEDTTCEDQGICHVPYEGRPEKVWWLGFDCAHFGDLQPSSKDFWKDYPEIVRHFERDKYRDVNYVKAECAKLAAQLAAMK